MEDRQIWIGEIVDGLAGRQERRGVATRQRHRHVAAQIVVGVLERRIAHVGARLEDAVASEDAQRRRVEVRLILPVPTGRGGHGIVKRIALVRRGIGREIRVVDGEAQVGIGRAVGVVDEIQDGVVRTQAVDARLRDARHLATVERHILGVLCRIAQTVRRLVLLLPPEGVVLKPFEQPVDRVVLIQQGEVAPRIGAIAVVDTRSKRVHERLIARRRHVCRKLLNPHPAVVTRVDGAILEEARVVRPDLEARDGRTQVGLRDHGAGGNPGPRHRRALRIERAVDGDVRVRHVEPGPMGVVAGRSRQRAVLGRDGVRPVALLRGAARERVEEVVRREHPIGLERLVSKPPRGYHRQVVPGHVLECGTIALDDVLPCQARRDPRSQALVARSVQRQIERERHPELIDLARIGGDHTAAR